LIVNGESEFDQNVLIFGNNFKIKYEQLIKTYNGRQSGMLLIKNVATTSKGYQLFENIIIHNSHKSCVLRLLKLIF